MKKVIFTTIQYKTNELKMLEVALKSFYRFNTGFDFKVYCLDNSKDKFYDYFNKFNFENLEFINFKDNAKWNYTLNRWNNLDFKTKFEKKNILKYNECHHTTFNFDIRMQISKFEILDDLINKYDLVIMSDIDLIFFSSITNIIENFLKNEYFVGALKETENYFNCGFTLFNSKFKILNIFEKCLNFLNEDLTENQNFYLWSDGKFFECFEQDLLNYLIQGNFFELKEIFCHTQNEECIEDIFKKNTFISIFHYAGPQLKPFNNIKHESKKFTMNFLAKARKLIFGQYKKYNVEIVQI